MEWLKELNFISNLFIGKCEKLNQYEKECKDVYFNFLYLIKYDVKDKGFIMPWLQLFVIASYGLKKFFMKLL